MRSPKRGGQPRSRARRTRRAPGPGVRLKCFLPLRAANKLDPERRRRHAPAGLLALCLEQSSPLAKMAVVPSLSSMAVVPPPPGVSLTCHAPIGPSTSVASSVCGRRHGKTWQETDRQGLWDHRVQTQLPLVSGCQASEGRANTQTIAIAIELPHLTPKMLKAQRAEVPRCA